MVLLSLKFSIIFVKRCCNLWIDINLHKGFLTFKGEESVIEWKELHGNRVANGKKGNTG